MQTAGAEGRPQSEAMLRKQLEPVGDDTVVHAFTHSANVRC